ncbi:hypothetical protein MRX96_032876 [Rhipicephalus microplus]
MLASRTRVDLQSSQLLLHAAKALLFPWPDLMLTGQCKRPPVLTNDRTLSCTRAVGHSDDNDADVYARNSKGGGNVQLDPPATKQDMWKDIDGVHHGPVARVYGTVSVKSSSVALITMGAAVRVDIVGEWSLRHPRRPQQLFPLLRPPVLYRRACS